MKIMKILFLQKRILVPAFTGGQVRTLGLLRHLARWHEITYVCNLQPGEERYLPEMRALGLRVETAPWRETVRGSGRFFLAALRNLFAADPYTVCKDRDPTLRALVARLLREQRHELLLCDFVQMAPNVPETETPVRILIQHNVEAELYRRQAESGFGRLRWLYLALQARKMGRFEAKAGRQFHAVIAISERDRRVFEQEYGWQHVHVSEVGVDLDYFQPREQNSGPDGVLFFGSLDWLPNEDGIRWFVRAVWPLVRQRCPQAAFRIVGRQPSAALRRLHAIEGIDVVGPVPDLRPYLAEAAVVVVPLLSGSGIRIKILEAMAMGKAIVSTSIGAEGLPIVPGKQLLLADMPGPFTDAISGLLKNSNWRKELGQAARAFVCSHCDAERMARRFEAICLETVRRCVPAHTPATAPID